MYTKEHPFFATLKERTSLCKPGSSKETLHISLDLKGGALPYKVGDSVAIFPENDPELVQKTLESLNLTGEEEIVDKRTALPIVFKDYLLKRGSITGFSRKLLNEVLTRAGEETEDPKKIIEERELWDLLAHYPKAKFSPQEIADLLMPLLPRFYSIASSPKAFPNEIHLTIAYLKYSTLELERRGVCTHFLTSLATMGSEIPLYIHPSHAFTLPEDVHKDIIMIGPGTGVAPFRAFLQEREILNSHGKNWLFFGERTRAHEFFYEKDWLDWENKGLLKLELAFSRDQSEKVYVQDLLRQNGAEVARWIIEGAILYVCGDAKHMAKDVDVALHEILKDHTTLDPNATLKMMKKEGRYLRDVY